jgi:hypothetical protein
MSGEFAVVDGLCVAFVEEAGDRLVVDLYGGRGPVCGTVRFRFPDRRERRRSLDRIRRWARDGVTVTLTRRGTAVSLVDERALRPPAVAGGATTA